MISITTATLDDINKLCDLLTLLFGAEEEFYPDRELQRQGLQLIIADQQIGEILVARRDNNIIGMVNILYTVSTALGGRVAILEDMIVLPEERNQHVGSLLIEQAVGTAKGQQCKRITLLTDNNNYGAHRFYERHGFQQSSMCAFRNIL